MLRGEVVLQRYQQLGFLVVGLQISQLTPIQSLVWLGMMWHSQHQTLKLSSDSRCLVRLKLRRTLVLQMYDMAALTNLLEYSFRFKRDPKLVDLIRSGFFIRCLPSCPERPFWSLRKFHHLASGEFSSTLLPLAAMEKALFVIALTSQLIH